MLTRRESLALLQAGPVLGQAALPGDSTRAARLKPWREAGFGMFIHWGLYSILGRQEWALEEEGIPIAEYERLAERFRPQPGCARAWAALARRAGQRYMVLTTKHHEGFCLFETRHTRYCAPQACGRDLVREYVEAARAEGLRVGFYYSLMDWHHPDGERCTQDEAARRRFIDYTHGQVRELLTNYGRVDILWYDMPRPLDENGWESRKLNAMVYELQPQIVVNNRNRLPGDFSTPEQRIVAESGGRAWESCMTLNDSWGYRQADDNWKPPKTIVRNLIRCARDGGNYLLNIGPRGDGSVPEESVRILETAGKWLRANGQAIYGSEPCRAPNSHLCADFTRKGNTLFIHVHFWPGEELAIGGLQGKILSARFLATGEKIAFRQDRFRTRFTGLPRHAPDDPVTVIAAECDSVPGRNSSAARSQWPRGGV